MWQTQIYLAERRWSLLGNHCLLNVTRNNIAWQKQPTASFQSKDILPLPDKLSSSWVILAGALFCGLGTCGPVMRTFTKVLWAAEGRLIYL